MLILSALQLLCAVMRTDRGVFERDNQDSGQDGVGTLRDLESVVVAWFWKCRGGVVFFSTLDCAGWNFEVLNFVWCNTSLAKWFW